MTTTDRQHLIKGDERGRREHLRPIETVNEKTQLEEK